MARLFGYVTDAGKVTVAIASGAGTQGVTFGQAFIRTPDILVQSHEGRGTYSAASATKSGFTATVAGASDLTDGDIEVVWFAVEKR